MLENTNVKELKTAVRKSHNDEHIITDINTYIEVAYHLNNDVGYTDDFVQLLVDLSESEENDLSDFKSQANKKQIYIWNNGIKDLIEDPESTCIDINDKNNRGMRQVVERVYDRIHQQDKYHN